VNTGDPMPSLLEVFTKELFKSDALLLQLTPRFMSMEFSQQPTILSEVINNWDACQDSERGLWKGESWAHGNSVATKSLTTLLEYIELLLFVNECTW